MSQAGFVDPRALRRRAQWALLRGRMRDARLELALAVGVALLAALVAQDARVVVTPALVLVGLAALWSLGGRAVARSVLPGLMLGVLPLGCSLAAERIGHVCWDGGCSSLCVPLCTAGGAVAGLLLARAARGTARPVTLWLSGGSLVLAAGAMGCACVGAAGLGGMLAGFLPSALVLAWPRRA